MQFSLLLVAWIMKKIREGVEKAAQRTPVDSHTMSSFKRNFEMIGRSCQTLSSHDYELGRSMLIASAEKGDFGMAAYAYIKDALGNESSMSSSIIAHIFNDAQQGDGISMSAASRIRPPDDFSKEVYLAIRIAVLVDSMKPNKLSFEDAAMIARNHKYLIGTSFTDTQVISAIALAKVLLEKSYR
jgi:hypothetical protein